MNDATSGSQLRDQQQSLPGTDANIADELEHGGTGPFAAAVQATRMPMVITNPRLPDNPIIFCNDAFCQLTGYSAKETIGRNCRFLQGPMTDPADVARLRTAIRDETPIELELRNHRKDGTPFWNRLFVDPVRDADGAVAYFFASQVEVTLERETVPGLETSNIGLTAKLADRLDALRDSEARLRFATQAGRLGIWELDLQTWELAASVTFKENFGRAHDAPFTFAELKDALHPADRARVQAQVNDCVATGADYDIEYRAIRPDGGVNWLQMRAQVVRAADGAAQRMAGISLDVTVRRNAEQRLRMSEESLRLATDAAGVGTWDLDVLTDELTWTPRTGEMFGVPPDAPGSRDMFYAGLHAEDRDVVAAAFEAALDPAREAVYDVEYRTVGSDGTVRWIAARGRGLFEDGRCVRLLGTAIDTTAQRADARRLAFLSELRERLRTLEEAGVIMETAVAALGWHLGANRVGYGEVWDDAHGVIIKTCHTNGVEALLGDYRISAFGETLAMDLRRGMTAVCHDVAADPALDAAAWDGIETRAFVCVPLIRGQQLRATMFVNWREAQALAPGDVALIEDVAASTWDAVERARAEAALRDADEARLRTIFETSFQWQALVSPDGTLLDANATALDVIGAKLADVVGRPYWETPWFTMTPGMPDIVRAAMVAAAAGMDARQEVSIHVPAGLRTYDFSVRPIRGSDGSVVGIVPAALDITERRQAEEALRQSQKMEAVGQLTGGIAHDFNNLLAGITGGLEMVQRRVAAGRTDGLERFTAAAITSAQRAASLTQRLLAFARRQPLDPRRVDADVLLAGMEDLLRRTLGPAIELRMVPDNDLWPTLCDPNQLEAAILNLAINARDAMPDGGRLTIGTANASPDEPVGPGDYVSISVTDTGAGMSPDVMARAFDPFFTTKPIGQGTGLGLSMLYGFVKQSDGHVRVSSAPGQGATFRLYLPRHHGEAPADAAAAAPASMAAPVAGTVLVVEDEATVRMLAVETLLELGYEVLQAADGAGGLQVLQSDGRVDLLVTDVGMPGLNGRQLADAARMLRPGLPVLFMTGYAHGAVGGGAALDAGMEILTKPFELDALAQKVRAMLDDG